jgi:DNA-directed RNA polymerase sigma subunit (sigma70/sigma32)
MTADLEGREENAAMELDNERSGPAQATYDRILIRFLRVTDNQARAERIADVMARRFGPPPRSREDVAADLGVTRQRIVHYEAAALRLLRSDPNRKPQPGTSD